VKERNPKDHLLFVHGFGFRNELFGLKYWGAIPHYLRDLGFPVSLLDSSAYSPLAVNLGMLKAQIHDLISHNPDKRYTLIGHSRGGVDALYLLQDPEITTRVNNLIILHSPIFGTKSAARILAENMDPNSFVFRYRQILGQIMGGPRAKAQVCLGELAANHGEVLTHVLDNTNVKIHWYYSEFSYHQLPRLWKIIVQQSYGKSLIGDGIVDQQPKLDHSNLQYINISHWDNLAPLFHWGLTGLPKIIRGRKHSIYKIYNEILKRAFDASKKSISY
jgi:pimeloyl-ACP methyl ester carboxylesterase